MSSNEIPPIRPRHTVTSHIMTQQWRDLSYVHWSFPPDEVQQLLPPGLEVDTFDGTAWVGLVPFRMENIAPRNLPAIPYFGTFPETNIRTYVRGFRGQGVWFDSLDVTRLLPVVVARATYRLPYMWSRMSIERDANMISYRADRRWPRPRGVASGLTLSIGEPIDDPSPLERFLSARWGLYTRLGRRLAHAAVDHEPWPLHRARLLSIDDDFLGTAGYGEPASDPHVMFSPGVSVRIERPRFAPRQ